MDAVKAAVRQDQHIIPGLRMRAHIINHGLYIPAHTRMRADRPADGLDIQQLVRRQLARRRRHKQHLIGRGKTCRQALLMNARAHRVRTRLNNHP